jgi:hypothetical protein
MGGVLVVKVGNSRLLAVGALGFLVGFGAWLYWLLLTVSALISFLLGYGYPNYMSGIFFQHWPFELVFRGLLSLSLVLESAGCFALRRKYGSNLALACGVVFLAIAVVLTVPLGMPQSATPPLLLFIAYNPALLLNVGLLVLGGALLAMRNALPNPVRVWWLGTIFVIVAVGTLAGFGMVVLYWGFEAWLLFLGWLYAVNSVATARLLLQLRTS